MRSLKFVIVFTLFVLSSAACVNNITPASSNAAPVSSPATGAPVPANSNQPVAAPAGSPASNAAPASGGSSQGTNTINNSPVSVQVTELRRTSGDMVMLRVTVTNTGTEDIPGPPARGALASSYLVDPAQQKKYEVVRDATGQPLASEIELLPIKAGAKRDFFAQFPAPPPTTTKMSVYFGGTSPIIDVLLTQ